MSARAAGLLIAAVILLPAHALAQSQPVPSFEAVIELRLAGSPALSPDGRHVAFTVRTTDWKENRYDTEIWLSRGGGAPFQLTRTAKNSSSSPRWSFDGRWIGFLSDRGEKQQVYAIALDGGEAIKLTSAENGVTSFRWSPDGKRLAYTTADADSPELKQRKEKFGEFAPEDEDWTPVHLWTVAVDEQAWAQGTVPPAVRLTEGKTFTVDGFAWSPDGQRIAFDHRVNPLITSGNSADISLVDIATRRITPLVTDPGGDSGPVWSPDGRWILYGSAGSDTTANFYRNNRLMRIAATGGPATRLATSFDEQIGGVAWTPLGIFFAASQKTRRQLYHLDPETGALAAVGSGALRVGGVDFSADGGRLAFSGSSATTLGEIYLTALEPFAPVAVTAMTSQLAGWPLGSSEVVSWKSRDGATIEGVLHKPAGFDPQHRYPLFVVIHGGPTGIDLPQPVVGGVYPVPQWLTRGALVLQPNYRGSAGYGEVFRGLNVRNLGLGDMWDVMSGVDHLVKQGIVDTTRMGAMGWSQGGYISAFLTTNTTRFKAISVGAGISNWITYYVATDIHPFTRQYLKATPWEDPEIYRKTSPMTTIRLARTPTLIQHGEFDRRVPIQNAYELFQGLQDQGVPVRLVVYKGFGHGITKPKEQLAAVTHNWEWFDKYVFPTVP
ncbi:MAG TPA: S9 family peptidase [Gemmatimonadales bacterium]|nr:S9 family peptidase [Gemmatimonadales bacterium]